jgi:hypothetical protein
MFSLGMIDPRLDGRSSRTIGRGDAGKATFSLGDSSLRGRDVVDDVRAGLYPNDDVGQCSVPASAHGCWRNGCKRPVLKHGPRSLTSTRVFRTPGLF